jgi:hypothetical protein
VLANQGPAARQRIGLAHSVVETRGKLWKHQRLLAGAGLMLGSSIAGVLVFDWYFDSVVGELAHSLRPISDAFHEMSGDRLRLELSRPVN